MKINSSQIVEYVHVETNNGTFRVDSVGNVEFDFENQYGAYEFKFVDFELMSQLEITEDIIKEISAHGLNILSK